MPQAERIFAAVQREDGSVMDEFRVENIGHVLAQQQGIRARFPSHGIVMMLRGCGVLRIEQGPIRRSQATAVFYSWPGPLFHYGPEDGSVWEERWLCLTGPRVLDWVRWGWLPCSDRPRRLLEPTTIAQTHRRLMRAFPPLGEF